MPQGCQGQNSMRGERGGGRTSGRARARTHAAMTVNVEACLHRERQQERATRGFDSSCMHDGVVMGGKRSGREERNAISYHVAACRLTGSWQAWVIGLRHAAFTWMGKDVGSELAFHMW